MDRYLVGLSGELARREIEITFFHRSSQPLHPSHRNIPGVSVKGLNDLSAVFWEQCSVPMALARGKFDLYHAPAERGVPFLCPCPVVLTFHSSTRESYRHLIRRGELPGKIETYLGAGRSARAPFFERYYGWQHFRADHILTPSQFSRGELIRLNRLPPHRVTVTPLAVAQEFHAPRKCDAGINATLRRLGIARPFVLYVGGYEAHKNIAGLLEMFSHVVACAKQYNLVCVGSSPAGAEVMARLQQLNLPTRSVVLLSGLTTELIDLYDAAELFVTMSWRESFCLPALEAMTRGKTVVASCWGAAPEVVGNAGILVDPRSPKAAAQRVLELLCDGQKSAMLAERAAVQSARFSWTQTADATMGVFERLLRSRRGSLK
ncbi:MAG TPA: glycosyltransferase family 1 protein [Terracidiphilus sp.]